jgi:hypothetical protein
VEIQEKGLDGYLKFWFNDTNGAAIRYFDLGCNYISSIRDSIRSVSWPFQLLREQEIRATEI